MKKHILTLISFTSVQAQLPPVFGEEYTEKATRSDMVKTYLTPQLILMKLRW